MALNYNRKSASSASRKPSSRKDSRPYSSRSTGRKSAPGMRVTGRLGRQSSQPRATRSYRAMPGGAYNSPSARSVQRLTSISVGDLDRAERAARAKSTYRSSMIRLGVIVGIVVVLIVAALVVYNSSLFTVENVTVTGVEHLTSEQMTDMANVPVNTTLLRVDTAGIRDRLLKNTWVKDVQVNRVFPNTLELNVTERTIAAVVDVPTDDARSTLKWAVSSDHLWLTALPDANSDRAKKISPKVYEDAGTALEITGVPFGIKAEEGAYCSDDNVNNALDIVSGLTTDLGKQVKSVSVVAAEETKLVLNNGVEIAFGKAENIRDKERVCLKIMEDNPGTVYLNVRVVDNPTWRSAS